MSYRNISSSKVLTRLMELDIFFHVFWQAYGSLTHCMVYGYRIRYGIVGTVLYGGIDMEQVSEVSCTHIM